MTVTMRMADTGLPLTDLPDVAWLLNRVVPVQIDGTTIREARVAAARVIDGQLEVDLAGLPDIWRRLYEQGKVTIGLTP